MAKMRIFLSSTCYDLAILRSELRPFILGMGYEPVMSEYHDVLYDPRSHTHDSCIKEVPSCDMVILVIGPRFGGQAIPSAMESFDFSILEKMSKKVDLIEYKEKLSITQLEVLKAVEQSIPVYVFVEDKVWHDHHVYEKNKHNRDIIDHIDFPSIQKKETARYIFEFINFLGHRIKNNSITPFTTLDDIKSHLVSQWSQLFQRILAEERVRSSESRRYHAFSEQLDDLKTVIMASLSNNPNLREAARGAIQYRRLVSFILTLKLPDHRRMLSSDNKWEDVLGEARIVDIREDDDNGTRFRPDVFLVVEDGTFYKCRCSTGVLDELKTKWSSFIQLSTESRMAIVDALSEDSDLKKHSLITFVNTPITAYLEERAKEEAVVDFREMIKFKLMEDLEAANT